MRLSEDGALLRIFIGEASHHDGKPLYEWIVLQAREQGLEGATVLRGMLGFSANSRQIHSFKIESLSEDLPVVVEIIDSRDNLEKFLDVISAHIPKGLVTMEHVELKYYRSSKL